MRQGVLGMTRTTRVPSGSAASRPSSFRPAAMETTRWRGSRWGASAARMPLMYTGFTPSTMMSLQGRQKRLMTGSYALQPWHNAALSAFVAVVCSQAVLADIDGAEHGCAGCTYWRQLAWRRPSWRPQTRARPGWSSSAAAPSCARWRTAGLLSRSRPHRNPGSAPPPLQPHCISAHSAGCLSGTDG
jgi:hypothetical protein